MGYLLYTSFGLQLQLAAIVNHFSFPLCKINVFILVRFNAVYVSGACELFLRRLCVVLLHDLCMNVYIYIWVTFKLPKTVSCMLRDFGKTRRFMRVNGKNDAKIHLLCMRMLTDSIHCYYMMLVHALGSP